MTDKMMKTPYKGECPLLPHDWTIGEFTNGDVGIFEEITGIARIINPNGGLDKEGAKKIAQFIIDSVNNYSRVCGELEALTKSMTFGAEQNLRLREAVDKIGSDCDESDAENESLRTKLENLKQVHRNEVKELVAVRVLNDGFNKHEIKALRAQNAKLVEALEFYANEKNYLPTGWQGDMNPSSIDKDKGNIAKAALSAQTNVEGGE